VVTIVYVGTKLVRQAFGDDNGRGLSKYALILMATAFPAAAGNNLASSINAVFYDSRQYSNNSVN
jgi:hypothetical protein